MSDISADKYLSINKFGITENGIEQLHWILG
jgi:hypothetical protein